MTLKKLRTVNKASKVRSNFFSYPAANACCKPSVGLFASGPKTRLNIFGTCTAMLRGLAPLCPIHVVVLCTLYTRHPIIFFMPWIQQCFRASLIFGGRVVHFKYQEGGIFSPLE